jgi:hypothetical protein
VGTERKEICDGVVVQHPGHQLFQQPIELLGDHKQKQPHSRPHHHPFLPPQLEPPRHRLR